MSWIHIWIGNINNNKNISNDIGSDFKIKTDVKIWRSDNIKLSLATLRNEDGDADDDDNWEI